MPKRGERPSGKKMRFTGPLAKPISVRRYRSTLVGLTPDEANKKTADEFAKALKLMLGKLDLLFEYFSIAKTGNPAEDYFALSLRLAQEFVPGLRLIDADGQRRGRPREDPLVFIRLLCDLELKKRYMKQGHSTDTGISDTKAIAALIRDRRFSQRWGSYEGRERTLANMLTKARDIQVNPLYHLWLQPGEGGIMVRGALIETFGSLTKNAL